MKIRSAGAWLLSLLLVACATVDNDPATTSITPFYDTRVDFNPISAQERSQQVAVEKKVWEQKEALLNAKLEKQNSDRSQIYDGLRREFPECGTQKYCQSPNVMRGNVKRFEAYNAKRVPLAKLDAQIQDTEQEIGLWRHRYDLRQRGLFNRYLVGELLKTPSVNSRLTSVQVISLEAYRDRATLSQRLTRLMEPGLVPSIVSDLDFRMMGKPVDESAVLALLDISVAPQNKSGKTERFYVNLLVNTYQQDELSYEKSFLEAWARKFIEPKQRTLRDDTFCALYSIASSSLMEKVSAGRVKSCAPAREAQLARSFAHSFDVGNPDNWLLPIAYVDVTPR